MNVDIIIFAIAYKTVGPFFGGNLWPKFRVVFNILASGWFDCDASANTFELIAEHTVPTPSHSADASISKIDDALKIELHNDTDVR
ncbi:hypothetical protein SCHPADRAFT_552534 [Schizopora paradoxa]|uniref:Uncharacterized protein n=1 Tax=Schizopora paradoxa TaxID=27342 RepID=A0A0H2RD21_9AGAM|nr:hypothetical protein SCHPADRAFT_552534 [Schizopora paradoxa]